MTAPIIGHQAKAYRNSASWATPTWSELTGIKDLTADLKADEADVTVRGGGGYKQTAQGLKAMDVEFEMIWDHADADFTALKAAYNGGTSVELLILDGSVTPASGVTVEGPHADFAVTSMVRNEALGEPLTAKFTLKPTVSDNAPEWYTDTGV